jgi:hypothetical protein
MTSTVQVSVVTVAATHIPSTVQVSEVTVIAELPVEPFTVITLPTGTWTQTSGATVTIVSNVFTVPATISGSKLTFETSSHKICVYYALPHTIWKRGTSTWIPLNPHLILPG